MKTTWNFSATNDEAALFTGVGVFVTAYLLDGEAIKTAVGAAVLAALAVLGYTGASKA